MICPRCHAENLSGTRFCGQCGAPLVLDLRLLRGVKSGGKQILRPMRHIDRQWHLASIGNRGERTGSSPPYRRVQTGHRPVLRHRQFDRPCRADCAEPLHELLRRFSRHRK